MIECSKAKLCDSCQRYNFNDGTLLTNYSYKAPSALEVHSMLYPSAFEAIKYYAGLFYKVKILMI